MISSTPIALGIAAALLLPLEARAATPAFYHSPGDDGTPAPAVAWVQVGTPQTLYLYGEAGGVASASGVVCEDGSGDEICGWDVLVEAREGVSLTAFRPEGDIQHSLGATVLRFHGGDHTRGALGPTKLGELDVDTSAAGSVQLTGAQAVGADLALYDLPAKPLLRVPEPTTRAGMLAGAFLLGLLARVDRRRSPGDRSRRPPHP